MGAHDLDAEGHWKWVEGNLKGNHSFLIYLYILKLIARHLIITDSYEIKVIF